MPTARKRKPTTSQRKTKTKVPGINRRVTDRYIELTAEPVTGMRMMARVVFAQKEQVQFTFDGTETDAYLRQSDVAVWMNTMRLLITAATDEKASLKQ